MSPISFGLLVAFAFARAFGPALRRPGGRAAVGLLVGPVLVASLYLAWATLRSGPGYWSDLGHGFPYPDGWINGLERWFDARYPAPPDTLKLHGEYFRVAAVLGMLELTFAAMTGWLIGLLVHRPAPTAGEARAGSTRSGPPR